MYGSLELYFMLGPLSLTTAACWTGILCLVSKLHPHFVTIAARGQYTCTNNQTLWQIHNTKFYLIANEVNLAEIQRARQSDNELHWP